MAGGGNWWGGVSRVYTKEITITLQDFKEDSKQAEKDFYEWSGNVSLTLGASDGNSMTFEEDTLATQNQENVLFADFIDPKIEVESSTINDENINSVTVRLKATDKYFTPESVISEDKVKVMIDGQYATEAQGIHISFGTEEELYTTRNSATEQYGVIQNITVTGIADKLDKNIQLVIESGAVADLSANTNEETKISLFNWLKDASSETSQTSAFLGMTTTAGATLQRQNIQSVEFLNSTATAPSKVISQATGVQDHIKYILQVIIQCMQIQIQQIYLDL